ncbi:Uncharacterised protein [Actinomyces bovis]|uniref:Uncharacterized protein n=1 Tax=Actinomyces bovis TaxID=1658 RepID=A0ABY1VPA5_9ACTO|nr:hypothetical protein [Actinomyces bovis]SPT53956.1 Uncharacterised protein [Actinomyces bovis]VEG53479.1 Uncharacterised protein [Actinomyces israelii]
MTGQHSRGYGDDDLDAAFAAMMEGLDISEDTRAGMAALDAAAEREATDVEEAAKEVLAASAASAGSPPASSERPDDSTLDAPPCGTFPGLYGPRLGESEPTQAVKIAVVLTPLANADALAQLCAMSGLDCTVVPTRTGAVAVKEFVSSHSEWDVAELLDGVDTEPAEAAELAGRLSHLSRGGTILLTADLATDVGIEAGLSGTITARGFERGQGGPDMSSGLVLASVDTVVEDLLFGLTKAEALPGAVRSSDVKLGPLGRWMGRGLSGGKGPAPM